MVELLHKDSLQMLRGAFSVHTFSGVMLRLGANGLYVLLLLFVRDIPQGIVRGFLGYGNSMVYIVLSLWMLYYILSLKEHSMAMFVVFSLVIAWFAPIRHIGKTLDKIGAVRENAFRIVPYSLDFLPHLPTLMPFFPFMVESIDEIAPLIDEIMLNRKYFLTEDLEAILKLVQRIVKHADHLKPGQITKLAPHMKKILPYSDDIVHVADECIEYLDELLLFLDVKGFELILEKADLKKVAKYISKVAPFAHRLLPYCDPMLQHMDLLLKNISMLDSLDIGELVDVLDKVVPLVGFLPAIEQTGLLQSTFAISVFPKMARFLPSTYSERKQDPLSPIPSKFMSRIEISVPKMHVKDDKVKFLVILNATYSKYFRFSELHKLDRQMRREISGYSEMQLLRFPPKKTFLLNSSGLRIRRIQIENYLDSAATASQTLLEESPTFRQFLHDIHSGDTFTL